MKHKKQDKEERTRKGGVKTTILFAALVALSLSLIGCVLTTKKPDSTFGNCIMRSGQLLGLIILLYIVLIS